MTIYDMALYICPTNGRQFLLGGLGQENCQSVLAADGWLDFHKNALAESFYVTADVVGRGADTSSLYTPDGLYHGTYYIQYTADKYGAAWAKRQMSVGEVYHRVCNIRTYNWDGRLIKTDVNVGSDLTVNAHHDRMTFDSGITVEDILELQWGGEERYFYANGCGLVGWRNLATGEQSFITSNSATIQPVHPIPTPRPAVAPPGSITPAPIPPTPPLSPLGLYKLTSIPASYINVRAAPIATSADVGDLHMGDVVQRFAPDVNGWTYVEKDALKGWTSLQGGSVVFTPVTAPAPLFRLKNPVGCAHIISAKFGVPRDYSTPPDGINESIHEGLDVTRAHADCTPLILNGHDGIVSDVSATGAYGLHVKVKSTVGVEYTVWYCHMAYIFDDIAPGKAIAAGHPIGVMGTSGNSTGVHVHINVQKDDAPTPAGSVVPNVIDPEKIIDW